MQVQQPEQSKKFKQQAQLLQVELERTKFLLPHMGETVDGIKWKMVSFTSVAFDTLDRTSTLQRFLILVNRYFALIFSNFDGVEKIFRDNIQNQLKDLLWRLNKILAFWTHEWAVNGLIDAKFPFDTTEEEAFIEYWKALLN